MSPAPQIPSRSEIPQADTWDLTHLFKTEEEYRKSFSELKNSYSKIAEFKGHLGDSPETLLKCLEFEKWLQEIAERLATIPRSKTPKIVPITRIFLVAQN